MAYQLKDQDVTPPVVDPETKRSVASDGVAAVAMVLLTAALITLILIQIIDFLLEVKATTVSALNSR